METRETTSGYRSSVQLTEPTDTQPQPAQMKIDEQTGNLEESPEKKSLAFKMSILALLIMCFIVTLDATILAVAVPVS